MYSLRRPSCRKDEAKQWRIQIGHRFVWEPDRNTYDIGGNYQLSEEEVEKKFIEM